MKSSRILPIRISLSPLEIDVGDISLFFYHFEKSVIKLKESSVDIKISLIGIKNTRGTTFETSSLQFDEYRRAYFSFVRQVKELIEKQVVNPAIAGHLKEILGLGRKRNFSIEFLNEERKTMVHITPQISWPETRLKGYTEVWGIIERVGGKEPHVVVRISDNQTVTVKLPLEKVKQLASFLYERVRIKGLGIWDSYGKLTEIEAHKLYPIKKPDRERIERIRQELGKFWQGFDVERELKELRAEY